VSESFSEGVLKIFDLAASSRQVPKRKKAVEDKIFNCLDWFRIQKTY
jgi:hypothetical protein